MRHNALLFGDYPIMVTKELATLLGLNEAIVLQQVHYWCSHNERAGTNYRDGYYWCFNSYVNWQKEFSWWGDKTIRTTFKKLENLGLLVTANYNRVKMDRTKWYRIDYDALDALIAANNPPPETENPQPFGKNYRMESVNITEPIPEIIKKNKNGFAPDTAKTSFGYEPADIDKFIAWYFEEYRRIFGKDHPSIRADQRQRVFTELHDFVNDSDFSPVDLDGLQAMAQVFFDYVKSNDWHISHFATPGILKHQFYEVYYNGR